MKKSYLLIGLFCLIARSFAAEITSINNEINEHLEAIKEPAVLLSEAWTFYDKQQLGSAFLFAQKAWQINGNSYSEASYLMGLISLSQAEIDLSTNYFNKALDEDYENKYQVKYLYALANSYLSAQDYLTYQAILHKIESTIIKSNDQEILMRQRKQAVNILLNQGLNRVIELYRWQNNASVLATELLAMVAYNQDTVEDSGEALTGFLYVTVVKAITILNRVQYYIPNYKFESLEKLLDDASSFNEIRSYIEESDFYRSYYFLASSIYLYNSSSQSKVLFNRIRLRGDAGEWAQRAEKQFWVPYFDSYNLTEIIPHT